MSCLWCLDRCVRTEPRSDRGRGESKKEPLVDLVSVLQQIAWKVVRTDPPQTLSLGERLCGLSKVLELEVDKTFIHIAHADTLTLHPKPKPTTSDNTKDGTDGEGDGPTDTPLTTPTSQPQGTTFLFQSQFHNDTQARQTYSFKTERQTRSAVEMSLQRGFTLGTNLEMDVKIPTGVKGCKVSGKLGGQMQWSFTRGKVSRQEEQVTWSVDSHVEVAPNSTGVATLAVQEVRWTADFSLDCVIRPRVSSDSDVIMDASDDSGSEDGVGGPEVIKFPVFVRRKATGELLQVVNIPRSALLKARPAHFKKCEADVSGVVCTLQGQCHSVCAVNQRVWLKEAELAPGTQRPGILHQDSVIIGTG